FFQAGDGIRAFHVTGVQTCALPISSLFMRGSSGLQTNNGPAMQSFPCLLITLAEPDRDGCSMGAASATGPHARTHAHIARLFSDSGSASWRESRSLTPPGH